MTLGTHNSSAVSIMKGAGLYTQDQTGRTALHQAAIAGDADAVADMLQCGADPNAQDGHLQTPVVLAAERGLYEVVRVLSEHDATDVNLQDSFGRTALHWCAKRCDVGGVEALLNAGKFYELDQPKSGLELSQPYLIDAGELSRDLHILIYRPIKKMAICSKAQGSALNKANVKMKTGGGDTALHWACSPEDGTTTTTTTTTATATGTTTIDAFRVNNAGSLQERSLKVVELLLAAGADASAKNERDLRPSDVATEDGVRVLLLSGLQEKERRERQEELEAQQLRAAQQAGAATECSKPNQTSHASSSSSSSSRSPSCSGSTAGGQPDPVPAVGGKGWGAGRSSGAFGSSSAFGAMKSGTASRSGSSSSGGTKKKIVIKLKKKS